MHPIVAQMKPSTLGQYVKVLYLDPNARGPNLTSRGGEVRRSGESEVDWVVFI